MKILMIYNPVSGKEAGRHERLGKVIRALGRNANELTLYQTRFKGDGAQYLAEHDGSVYEMIVVCGGDGTLHEIVNAKLDLKLKCKLGYIPFGSTNDYATNLGISQNTAVNFILRGKSKHLDIGRFNGEYFNYVAAFGSLVDVSFATSQDEKNSLGYLAYLLEGIKQLDKMKSYHLKCKTDDGEFEDKIMVGIILNSLSVGGMKQKNSKAKLDDGLMEYVFIKEVKSIYDVQAIITLLLQSKYDKKYMYYGQSSRFLIESDEMAWSLDGENGGTWSRAEITNQYKELEIIVGDME